MDASPPSPSLSSLAPEPQEHRREQLQTVSKKIRITTLSKGDNRHQHTKSTAPDSLRLEPDHIVTTSPASLDGLPAHILRKIGAFAAGRERRLRSRLSGASRTTLDAVREVHLSLNTRKKHGMFCDNETPLLLIGPTGALKSGRVVVHITKKYAAPFWGSEEAIEAFEKFMRHTIPTLRSINLHVGGGKCFILDALIPRSSKRYIVAPNLTRVKLQGQATLVHKAGKVIKAGLWPALEELNLSECRANAGHFENLAQAIWSGRAPNLRLLNWNGQSEIREKRLDNVVLSALASGQCPLIERLSFTDNRFCPEHDIQMLGDALRACSNLRVLEMDCSRSPGRELRTLTRALQAGHVPHLIWIYARATKPYDARDGTREGVKLLRRVAAQRATPVEIHTEIKTCHPKYKRVYE